MIDSSKVNIAIVGGGFCGTLAAVHLARQFSSAQIAARVFLIEKTTRLARGLAYSTDCDLHLLNVPAEKMSALPQEPDHFVAWLNEKFLALPPSAFVPRKIYGQYLRHLLDSIKLNKSVEIEVVQAEAVSLSADEKILMLDSGRLLNVDKVILATGNFSPRSVGIDGVGHALYRNDPWSQALEGLNPDDDVVLIGTGLTMVDLALQLDQAGYRGMITAISRHGLLPSRHRLFNRLQSPSPINFLADPLPTSVRELFAVVRKACRVADMLGDGDWRLVIDQLRPHTQKIWRCFSNSDRRRFLRHVRPVWEVVRHRMPLEVASAVEQLRNQSRLQIIAGRIQAVQFSAHAAHVRVAQRTGAEVSVVAQRVINCTGPDIDLRNIADAFVSDLREKGLIQADALGLGVQTNESGYVLQSNGTASKTLLAMGTLRKGQLWETTAVPELRVQAEAVASRIVESLTPIFHARVQTATIQDQ